MVPLQPPTLAEGLDAHVRLEIFCTWRGCRHHVFWSRELAVERLGGRLTFAAARERLVCGACRDRGEGVAGQYVQIRPAIADVYDRLRAAGLMGGDGKFTPDHVSRKRDA